jgi:glycerophosphoryl diester phosphodiesterase
MGLRVRTNAWGRLAALITVGALFALILPASAGATDWTKLRALNITHQGGEDEAPSATMYAFERSMKLGSDMLEVDVNVTKDGKLAIIHDGSVDRTTNATGEVADFTMRARPRSSTPSAASAPATRSRPSATGPATSARLSSRS